MSIDCTIDNAGCIVCPALPAVTAVPARVVSSPNYGWNAGANSVSLLDGNVSVTDTIDLAPVDIFVGLKSTREVVGAPMLLGYALRFYSAGTSVLYEVWEAGKKVRNAVAYTLGTSWEIRRVNGVVSYYVNSVLLHESTVPSRGPVLVSSCLYAATDQIP